LIVANRTEKKQKPPPGKQREQQNQEKIQVGRGCKVTSKQSV